MTPSFCADNSSGNKVGAEMLSRLTSFNNSAKGFVQNDDAPHQSNPFFVADLGGIRRQYSVWRRCLPRVEPFYAVKCNADPGILAEMSSWGIGFDCASKAEMSAMMNVHGVAADRIVCANPCKPPGDVLYARENGVMVMTFDNREELCKVKKLYPQARLLLRIMTDDSTALCRLSIKYGAPMSSVRDLLALAKDLDLHVAGVAFHVGSGVSDSFAFEESIANARKIFDMVVDEFQMEPMSVLDIGGGFVDELFESTAQTVNSALEKHFPEAKSSETFRIIAEPGRFFVAKSFTLAVSVISLRRVDSETEKGMVYVNDGLYGNLNCIVFDHQKPVPRLLYSSRLGFLYGQNHINASGPVEVSVWGPTCDGLDCITTSCSLPTVPQVNDWLYFENMGAYTLSAASRFNGFGASDVYYVE